MGVCKMFCRPRQRPIDDGRTFDADDPQSLVQFLRKLDDLVVESAGDGVVVRSK